MSVWILGCSGSGGPGAPNPVHESQLEAAPDTVAFADTSLAAAVRQALGIDEGPVAAEAVGRLLVLDASGRGITSLEGIEALAALEGLLLAGNEVADLTPLGSLTRLNVLVLTANQVADLSPLTGLQQLEIVALDSNAVADIRPLLQLPNLRQVDLTANPLDDGAVAAIIELTERGVEVTRTAPEDSAPTAASVTTPSDGWWLVLYRTVVSGGKITTQMYALGAEEVPYEIANVEGVIFDAKVSADGALLAYSAWRDAEGDAEIYLLNLVTATEVKLTYNDDPDVTVAWSPDGQLAYSGRRDGNYDIYLTAHLGDGTGDDALRLTTDPGDDWSPSWAPDGGRVAFTSDRDGDRDIYVLTLADGQVSKLYDSGAEDAAPVWSPDGKRLAFSSNLHGNYDVYVIELEGEHKITQLTGEPGDEVAWAWSPDGTQIAFTRARGGHKPEPVRPCGRPGQRLDRASAGALQHGPNS